VAELVDAAALPLLDDLERPDELDDIAEEAKDFAEHLSAEEGPPESANPERRSAEIRHDVGPVQEAHGQR
jgi:hypothetical protein